MERKKKQIKRICAFDPQNTDLVYMALPRDVCIKSYFPL